MTIDLPPEPPAIIQPSYNNIERTNKMIGQRPDWLLDSPYFYIDEEGGWALKDDAPEDLKLKFKELMDEIE